MSSYLIEVSAREIGMFRIFCWLCHDYERWRVTFRATSLTIHYLWDLRRYLLHSHDWGIYTVLHLYSTEFIQFSLAKTSPWIMNCGLFFDHTFRDSKSSKLRPLGVGMDRAQPMWLTRSSGNGNFRAKNSLCAYVSAIQFIHWFFAMMIRRHFFVCVRQHFLHYYYSWV